MARKQVSVSRRSPRQTVRDCRQLQVAKGLSESKRSPILVKIVISATQPVSLPSPLEGGKIVPSRNSQASVWRRHSAKSLKFALQPDRIAIGAFANTLAAWFRREKLPLGSTTLVFAGGLHRLHVHTDEQFIFQTVASIVSRLEMTLEERSQLARKRLHSALCSWGGKKYADEAMKLRDKGWSPIDADQDVTKRLVAADDKSFVQRPHNVVLCTT